MILKSILRLSPMMIIVVAGTLVFPCFSAIQQQPLQQATALVLQDSLLEFSQNKDKKNDYYEDENLVYTNIVTSTSSNSESPLLLQTGSNKINFDKVRNLTNNLHDSVYGQVDASSENDVYIVWQDSVPGSAGSYKNYDIFFTKSSDAGTSFGWEINLSNYNGFSEHPQLATSGNNVYVVWADNSFSANREIFFAKSTDGGNTFGNPINLSNNLGDSYNQEIFVFGDDIYVVWLDKEEEPYESEDSHSNILIKSSIDGGATFGQTLSLSNNNNSNANDNSFPKVAAYNNYVYVIWNVEDMEEDIKENTGQLSSSEERSNSNNNTGL